MLGHQSGLCRVQAPVGRMSVGGIETVTQKPESAPNFLQPIAHSP